MSKATTSLSIILCVLLCTLPGASLSQTQEPRSAEEVARQQMQERQKEDRQRADEQHERMIRRQEEFNQRIEKQERQRLQELWPTLSPEERQRREQEQQRKEEQRRQSIQRQREFWQEAKQRQQRAQEQRLKDEEEQKAIAKTVAEYSDEAWQDMLGVTPEQWKALQPRLETIRKLKELPYMDFSIFWLAGSGGYEAQIVAKNPDGSRSVLKTSGQYSVTEGIRTAAESSIQSGDHENAPVAGSGDADGGPIRGGQISAMTGISMPVPGTLRAGAAMKAGGASEDGRRSVEGTIRLNVSLPGPVKKQVRDINLGWQWQRPSFDRVPNELTEGDRACEQLIDALEVENSDPAQVRQRIEALRQVRQQQQAQLQQTRQQLRALVTPEQEAKLILMGYLE